MVGFKQRVSASWAMIQSKMRRSSKSKIESMTLPPKKYPTNRLSNSCYTKNITVITSTTVEPPKDPKGPECVVCMDELPADQLIYFCLPSPSDTASDSNPSNANHGYCDGCLVEGIRSATKGRYPFRCCGEIYDTKDYQGTSLSAEEKQAYEDIIEELTTSNPLYCFNRQCGSFIKPALIRSDLGFCPKCTARTCKHCRQAFHPKSVCHQDKDTLKVLALGKKRGWKICPACGYMVELVKGCHIVKCRCAWSFCYRCGASNASSLDDRRHTWHQSCWRPEDYAAVNTPPEVEQPQRHRHGLFGMLDRVHDQWRHLEREWKLELERERLRQREWARELAMAVYDERDPLQPAAKSNGNNNYHNQQARALPRQSAQPRQQPRQQPRNPLDNRERGFLLRQMMVPPTRPNVQQFEVNRNNNNNNNSHRCPYRYQARPQSVPTNPRFRNPPNNREYERGFPWQHFMVAPTSPVFQQPQVNPRPTQPPEPRGQGRGRR